MTFEPTRRHHCFGQLSTASDVDFVSHLRILVSCLVVNVVVLIVSVIDLTLRSGRPEDSMAGEQQRDFDIDLW